MLTSFHYAFYNGLQLFRAVLVPVCFVLAWLLVIILGWSLWSAIRDAVNRAKQMHEIPCANCQFFTNTHYLKCPVHPQTALSEEAIGCPDYKQHR